MLWDDAFDAETAARLFSTSALSAPAQPSSTDETFFETAYPPPPGARLNPLNRPDCERIQRRLLELGYLSGGPDGLWGVASRSALRAFKAAKGLPADDEWDAAAETAVNDEHAVRAIPELAGARSKDVVPCPPTKLGHDEGNAKAGRNEEPRPGCEARGPGSTTGAGEATGSALAKPPSRLPVPGPDKRSTSMSLNKDVQRPLPIVPVTPAMRP